MQLVGLSIPVVGDVRDDLTALGGLGCLRCGLKMRVSFEEIGYRLIDPAENKVGLGAGDVSLLEIQGLGVGLPRRRGFILVLLDKYVRSIKNRLELLRRIVYLALPVGNAGLLRGWIRSHNPTDRLRESCTGEQDIIIPLHSITLSVYGLKVKDMPANYTLFC